MERKYNLTDEDKILIIKWESLKRNEEYRKLWEEFEKEKNKANFQKKYLVTLKEKFGIHSMLNPDISSEDTYFLIRLRALFRDSYFLENTPVFVDVTGGFQPQFPFPENIIVFYVNLEYPKEMIMKKIEKELDAVRRGKGLVEFSFTKKDRLVKKERTVKLKRIERKEDGSIDLEYYMKCFKVWDWRKEGLSFIKIGKKLSKIFPPPAKGYIKSGRDGIVEIKKHLTKKDWDKYGYQEKASLVRGYYNTAKKLIEGGFRRFGKIY